MEKPAQRPAGTWSLAAGHSTSLQPQRCGYLAARGGALLVNGASLPPGEPVRIWSGERVHLKNAGVRDDAFFAWDYCVVQPAAKGTRRAA